MRLALPLAVVSSCGPADAPPAESSPTPSVLPDPVQPTATDEPTVTEPATGWADNDRSVLLVSLDGFRHDYMEHSYTPTLDRLVAEGVRADGLVPVFPSKTFPNHFSQVTGLHPSEHGIVGNSFYDEELGDSFDMDELGSEWWGGEPIWVTAAKQGLRTTTMFWPGSETSFDGWRPDEWFPYDGWMGNAERVAQVLAWYDEPQRPHFATLYLSDTDSAGHSYGPLSSAVDDAVRSVDASLARLVDGLEERGILDEVDLIVVSDHGMTELSRERAIFLDDHIDPDDFWIAAWGPYVTLDPVSTSTDLDATLQALADLPHASCSDDATRPPELHFPSGPRIPPLVCIADNGWGITTREWFDTHPDDLTGATHGYRPDHPDMHGLFVARGPHFATHLQHPAFSSVHLYELMSHLLQIEPSPNSGSLQATAGLLR
jgi:predicted AlkP superfamily pyrophosphatase or phosphodiesterase